MQPPPKKLLDQVRDAIRLKHYVYRTEETYVQWIRHYILFLNKRHPKEMRKAEIEAFLTPSCQRSGLRFDTKSSPQCLAVSLGESDRSLRNRFTFLASN